MGWETWIKRNNMITDLNKLWHKKGEEIVLKEIILATLAAIALVTVLLLGSALSILIWGSFLFQLIWWKNKKF